MNYVFSGWEEHVVDENLLVTRRRLNFLLKRRYDTKIIAVRGVERSSGRSYFSVDRRFAIQYGQSCGFTAEQRWTDKLSVSNWLNNIICTHQYTAVGVESSDSNDKDKAALTTGSDSDNTDVVIAERFVVDRFSVVIESKLDEFMEVPSAYVRTFTHVDTKGRIILIDGSEEWEVYMEDNLMTYGWKDFADDHKLRTGETVVFSHKSRNSYDVAIFERDGSGVDFSWNKPNINSEAVVSSNMIDDMSSEEEAEDDETEEDGEDEEDEEEESTESDSDSSLSG